MSMLNAISLFPNEILQMIFKYFDYSETENLRRMSKQWNDLIERVYDIQDFIVICDNSINREIEKPKNNYFMIDISKFESEQLSERTNDLKIIEQVMRHFLYMRSIRVYMSLSNHIYDILQMVYENSYTELKEIIWYSPKFNIDHGSIKDFCQKFPKIECFKLRASNGFSIKEESLSELFKMLEKLRVFELSGYRIEHEGTITGQCFEYLGKNVTSLTGGNVFTDTAFSQIANRAPNLTELNTNDGISLASMALISEKCTNLKILKFNMQKDNKENAMDTALKYSQFIGSFNMLEDLSIHFPNKGNVITFNNEMALFLGKCSKIKKLKVLNVVIKDEVPLAIIAEKFLNIEYLYLDNVAVDSLRNFERMTTLNNIEFNECIADDAKIASMIRVCPNLKRIKINRECNASIETYKAVIELARQYPNEIIRVRMKSKALRKELMSSGIDLTQNPKNLDDEKVDEESNDDKSFRLIRKLYCISI